MARDLRPTILGLSIAFPIIAIISVVLRFEARRIKRLKLGADDWTILAALLLTIGVTLDVVIDSRLGDLGVHTVFMPDGMPVDKEQFEVFTKTLYVLELLLWPSVGLNKISVLLLYKRIFTYRGFKILVWCSIGIVTASTIAFTFALMFSCRPISARWNDTLDFTTCVDQTALLIAALATDVITDGLILILPVYNIWKLQMPLHRKLAIIGIFLLGGLVTITGIIRLHFFTLIYSSLKSKLFTVADSEYSYAPVLYWSIIETNVGILSACLPTFRPLYDGYRLNTLASRVSLKPIPGYSDNIRLNLAECGYLSNDSKATRFREHDPYAVYDDVDLPSEGHSAT
ncbi:hypothetical protein MMC20_001192 [Loxospora ochrophaea]|nr:hypothetical protein [Loxospora ochrophaea]